MKLNGLIIIELVFFTIFWVLAFGGAIGEFNTIMFFEPEFTYWLIAMSILTGMLIGGLVERRDQERKNKQYQTPFNPCSLCQTKDDPCQYRKNLEPGKDCIMRIDL